MEEGAILDYVLLAFQLCLAFWQIMKFTLLGVLIQGVIGCLLRPFCSSTAYAQLQRCDGLVFKRANCYVLQPDIPSERSIGRYEVDKIILHYLGSESILERRGSHKNMLFINKQMRYYITPIIWEELQTLGHVLRIAVAAEDDHAAVETAARAASAKYDHVAAAVAAAEAASAANTAADAIYDAAASSASLRTPAVFVKSWREIWEEVITGDIMTLEEILDGIILYSQRVSVRLNDDWLLPVNTSVSKGKLPRILNLVGLFLQAKRVNVHWFLPTSFIIISALLEFLGFTKIQ